MIGQGMLRRVAPSFGLKVQCTLLKRTKLAQLQKHFLGWCYPKRPLTRRKCQLIDWSGPKKFLSFQEPLLSSGPELTCLVHATPNESYHPWRRTRVCFISSDTKRILLVLCTCFSYSNWDFLLSGNNEQTPHSTSTHNTLLCI